MAKYNIIPKDAILAIATLTWFGAESLPAQGAPWTPKISVEKRYIYFDNEDEAAREVNVAHFSPNGAHFFILSRSADIEKDLRIYEISVYSTAAVMAAISNDHSRPPPLARIIMSHQYLEAVRQISWEDNISFTFIGNGNNEGSQVFRYTLETDALVSLTNTSCANLAARHGVHRYIAGLSRFQIVGKNITYFCSVDEVVEASYPIQLPTSLERKSPGSRTANMTLGFARSASGQEISLGYSSFVQMSPDGRRAIAFRVLEQAPSAWAAYDGKSMLILDRERDQNGRWDAMSQFWLIDFEKEVTSPVVDAPAGTATSIGNRLAFEEHSLGGARRAGIRINPNGFPSVFWSSDSKSIVLFNTALPLESGNDANMAFIVSYDIERKAWKALEPMRNPEGMTVSDAVWIEEGSQLLVRHVTADGKPDRGTLYRYLAGRWQGFDVDPMFHVPSKETKAPSQKPLLSVSLHEGASEPQTVLASANGKTVELIGKDARLQEVEIASQSAFEWVDGRGMKHLDAIVLPPNYDGKSKIPLVIQLTITNRENNAFRPDETRNSTAQSAQSLAARGIAVLRVVGPESPYANFLGAGEGFRGPEVFASSWLDPLVDEAARQFPIDRQRVGIIGFSAFGAVVRYTVTHPLRTRLAAALIADSNSRSIPEYFLMGADRDRGTPWNLDMQYADGETLYENKQAWTEKEVDLNVGRVTTPTLFVDNRIGSTVAVQTMGAFDIARRPYDYILLPAGSHQLRTPRQRQASLNATVDWFSFWLLGNQTPRNEDPTRYVRWQKIKADWAAQQAWEEQGYPVSTVPKDPYVINRTAYRALYWQKDVLAAIRMFQDNITYNQHLPWVFDSLAEGFLQAGDIEQAVANYEKAAAADPVTYTRAAEIAAELRSDPSDLFAIQRKLRDDYLKGHPTP